MWKEKAGGCMNSQPHPENVDEVEAWIAAARGGSPEALGQALEQCRGYLLQVANAELDGRLRGKAGASDLVQETFLVAQRIFDRFRGSSQPDLRAWLRGVLLHKVAKLRQRYGGTRKRLISREVALEAGSGPRAEPVAAGSTPSQVAQRQEQAEAVKRVLDRLPEHYRQVIVWREWEELPFDEIARRLGRGVDAARMLWWRAIERLQHELESGS